MKSLLILALFLVTPVLAADPSPEGSVFDSIVGRVTHFIDGYLRMGNTGTPPTTITLDGPNGEGVFVGSITASNITIDESSITTALAGGATPYLKVNGTSVMTGKLSLQASSFTIGSFAGDQNWESFGIQKATIQVLGHDGIGGLNILSGGTNNPHSIFNPSGNINIQSGSILGGGQGVISLLDRDDNALLHTDPANAKIITRNLDVSGNLSVSGTAGSTNITADESLLSTLGVSTNTLHTENIVTSRLDLSTVTTAIATKQNSFIGVSSACASGQYWSTGTWTNGVLTGGNCVTFVTPPTIVSSFTSLSGLAGRKEVTEQGLYPYNYALFIASDAMDAANGDVGLLQLLRTTGGPGSDVLRLDGRGLGGFDASEVYPSYIGVDGTVRLGIGITTPQYPLDVSGRVNASGGFGGGAIDTADVNLATVTTALAGKAPTFVGITSSCASGFHVSTDTYVNGILTGGSCVVDGSGGGGGSSTMTITAVSDNFIGQVTGSLKTFTLSQTPANAAALSCVLDGLVLSGTSDYTYAAPTTITVTTAPSANSTGFFCNYFVNTSTLPAAFILTSTQTVSGATTFNANVTAVQSTFTFSTGTYVTYNTPGTNQLNSGQEVVYAQWQDAVAQSSGCIVQLYMASNSPTAAWNAKTVTSGALGSWGLKGGVLLDNNCTQNSWCRIGKRGTYRVVTDASGIGATSFVTFSATACRAIGEGSNDMAVIGRNIGGSTSVGANTSFWMELY